MQCNDEMRRLQRLSVYSPSHQGVSNAAKPTMGNTTIEDIIRKGIGAFVHQGQSL